MSYYIVTCCWYAIIQTHSICISETTSAQWYHNTLLIQKMYMLCYHTFLSRATWSNSLNFPNPLFCILAAANDAVGLLHTDCINILCYCLQVWRHVSDLTYEIIHQVEFAISRAGFHEFMLSPGKRDNVKVGDAIGLFTCLPNEMAVISFDTIIACSPSTVVFTFVSEVTTPLTFTPDPNCRNYSMNALFTGKETSRLWNCETIHSI